MALGRDHKVRQSFLSLAIPRSSASTDDFATSGSVNKVSSPRVDRCEREFEDVDGAFSSGIEMRHQIDEAMLHRQRLETIGQLTAGIAHDFNNLLTAIMGNLTLLMGRLEDAQARRLARRSLLAAEHAASVTKRLLVLGRRQSHHQLRRVDINRFVSSVLPRLRDVAGSAIDVEVTSSASRGLVKIDPIQLELALINLATNARDAMPNGGRIVVETSSLRIDGAHQHAPPGDWVIIRVVDTGCGMSAEIIAHAFEPFFTTKGVGAGTGLGLSLVRDVIKQLAGEVSIRSHPGAGTSVIIYLPRSRTPAKGIGPVVSRRQDRRS